MRFVSQENKLSTNINKKQRNLLLKDDWYGWIRLSLLSKVACSAFLFILTMTHSYGMDVVSKDVPSASLTGEKQIPLGRDFFENLARRVKKDRAFRASKSGEDVDLFFSKLKNMSYDSGLIYGENNVFTIELPLDISGYEVNRDKCTGLFLGKPMFLGIGAHVQKYSSHIREKNRPYINEILDNLESIEHLIRAEEAPYLKSLLMLEDDYSTLIKLGDSTKTQMEIEELGANISSKITVRELNEEPSADSYIDSHFYQQYICLVIIQQHFLTLYDVKEARLKTYLHAIKTHKSLTERLPISYQTMMDEKRMLYMTYWFFDKYFASLKEIEKERFEFLRVFGKYDDQPALLNLEKDEELGKLVQIQLEKYPSLIKEYKDLAFILKLKEAEIEKEIARVKKIEREAQEKEEREAAIRHEEWLKEQESKKGRKKTSLSVPNILRTKTSLESSESSHSPKKSNKSPSQGGFSPNSSSGETPVQSSGSFEKQNDKNQLLTSSTGDSLEKTTVEIDRLLRVVLKKSDKEVITAEEEFLRPLIVEFREQINTENPKNFSEMLKQKMDKIEQERKQIDFLIGQFSKEQLEIGQEGNVYRSSANFSSSAGAPVIVTQVSFDTPNGKNPLLSLSSGEMEDKLNNPQPGVFSLIKEPMPVNYRKKKEKEAKFLLEEFLNEQKEIGQTQEEKKSRNKETSHKHKRGEGHVHRSSPKSSKRKAADKPYKQDASPSNSADRLTYKQHTSSTSTEDHGSNVEQDVSLLGDGSIKSKDNGS